MLRTFAAPLVVFLLAFALGLALILFSTRDPIGALSRSLTDEASTPAASADPAADALGTPLGDPVAETAPAADPTQQLGVYLDQARSSLILWHALTMAAGLATAWVWLMHARGRDQRTSGTVGQRSAAFGWFLGLLAWLLLAAAAAGYALVGQGLQGVAAAALWSGVLAMTLLMGLIAYHAATALGTPYKMRMSIPLAGVWRRKP